MSNTYRNYKSNNCYPAPYANTSGEVNSHRKSNKHQKHPSRNLHRTNVLHPNYKSGYLFPIKEEPADKRQWNDAEESFAVLKNPSKTNIATKQALFHTNDINTKLQYDNENSNEYAHSDDEQWDEFLNYDDV
ncbi:hypothetical protein [Pseudochelatococcus sp. G4_1912]|uniref:hypothetical protein n=1 Tax=Pseudochelatococcus sp. G4_1912 TaxID=3114288 RepID=UPI0039C6672D